MQATTHDLTPQYYKETPTGDHNTDQLAQQPSHHEADETTDLLDLATKKNGPGGGVDINKMMLQASSFLDNKNNMKSYTKFHEITTPRSDFTPVACAHELNPSGKTDPNERTPGAPNETRPEGT